MPSWETLSSSMLDACRFVPSTTSEFKAGADESTGTLELRFKNGNTYTYDDVPISIYTGLLSASSAGKYYNEMIKGQYD